MTRKNSNQRAAWWGLLLLGSALSGCAAHPAVKSGKLPVRRVVVYRNGVAYFERSGHVDSDHVDFRLRQENVGDFLATLAVMERGGHSVRAASFPVELEQVHKSEDPHLESTMAAWEGKEPETRKLRTVSLELDGESHDLTVGYLAETPVWRPSYRLVVGESGSAVLQAWGIVQNQSGEDWRDVDIALVAGAPIAFESTLGDPVIPERPIVTDEGEVIQRVPEATTTYQETQEEVPAEEESLADADDMAGAASRSRPVMKSEAAPAPQGSQYAPGAPERGDRASVGTQSLAPRDQSGLARVQLQTGATRYEVPHRVTIPDKSATMVLLVSKKVPGEAVYYYAPDYGVPDSYAHPFRVARFKNESGGLLERGPIAVFEKGAFLGQGVVESLPTHARATVPFALMRSVSIRREVTHDQRGARLYAVRHGELSIERDQATISAYHLKNGEPNAARVLIRHERLADAELWEPPKGTEEIADERAALVPVDVPAFGKARLMIEERQPIRRIVDFRSMEARAAVRDYLKSKDVESAQSAVLQSILKYAAQLATIDDQERRLTREQRELEKSTEETRSSLKAIRENRQAEELRVELTQRLAEGTRRLDEITKELIELRMRRTEQEVRLKEAAQGLEIPPRDERD